MGDPILQRLHHRVLLAAFIAFGVVLWEHVVHTVALGDQATLAQHATHVLRDATLALPIAFWAVWGGAMLAGRLWPDHPNPLLPRAALTSVVYAALLVPSTVAHGLIDSGASPIGTAGGGHAHAASGLEAATTLPYMLLHGLRDALIAQVAALPLTMIGLSLVVMAAAPRLRRKPLPRRARLSAATAAVTLAALVFPLGTATPAVASHTNPCDSAQKRTYDVSAINVRITYDNFGDNDPFGFMYALDSQIDEIRAAELSMDITNGLRKDPIQPLMLRASLGECLVINFTNRLQQPPRSGSGSGNPANERGFRQQPGGIPSVSISPSGVAYEIDSAGNAVGNNPNTLTAPGDTRTYRFYLDPFMGEGGKPFHSGGDTRELTAHGLFGAILAEPAGSRWLDPETGQDKTNDPNWANWEAIINPARGVSFREFGIMYHEVGNEQFNVRRRPTAENQDVLARNIDDPEALVNDPTDPDNGLPIHTQFGRPNGMVDVARSNAYLPVSRAINYRSEPFIRRLEISEPGGPLTSSDKSQGYGSYTFGDPATPIPRSYLGEPTKTRLMHPGSEQLHVHHLHGGGDRWRANPNADPTNTISSGLDKTPPTGLSIRLDSQTVGPDESYNLEHECGAGGCQQAAGDFLYHCHIAHHYIAGMWGFWRVFDTRQGDDPGETPLAVIPGRDAPPTAVDSSGLIGKTFEGTTITAGNLDEWVEPLLPPQGVPLDEEDATVWNWTRDGNVLKGEPEVTAGWENYQPLPDSVLDGERRPTILFNPTNGRPAWPLLRPHLGKRPPFSPNEHSGAPWLGENGSEQRPDGLCPQGAPKKVYNITAITLPIQTTDTVTDPNGEIFVLSEDREEVLSGQKEATPLAIRSNVGDCVEITLSSELDPSLQPKVNMHTHFVQFDPQASDGVITGLSYEQSVWAQSASGVGDQGRTLAAAASAGDTQVTVTQTDRLRPGIAFAVSLARENIEIRTITAINGNTITLDRPLDKNHAAGDPAGVEFVQYRWFSDVDFGTVFWHDHVDGIKSWAHGLFGAHIVEPKNSTYHDPQTGDPIRSGPIADIHTSGSVGFGQSGSFRELVLWMSNGRPGKPPVAVPVVNFGQECEIGSFNLRAEPFQERSAPADQRTENGGGNCADTVGTVDPHIFSSVKYGDPNTPLLRAYTGDPVVIRGVGVAERVEALRIEGHRFRIERWNGFGQLSDTATIGISERADYVIDGGAGGPARMPGDYLYYSTRDLALVTGAWGIFRVHDKREPDLQPLPGRTPGTGEGFPILTETGGAPPAPTSGNTTGDPNACPGWADTRRFDVSVFNMPLPAVETTFTDGDDNTEDGIASQSDPDGIVYSLAEDEADIRAGTKPLEPLVIRANLNECVEITLTNHVAEGTARGGTRASLSLAKLLRNPQWSGGAAVGFNPDTTVARNDSITYRFFADQVLGTSLFQNLGSPASLLHGAYGAVIVELPGSSYRDNHTGRRLESGTEAIIDTPFGSFREYVTLFSSTEQQNGRSILGLGTGDTYEEDLVGYHHVNYRNEPLPARYQSNPDRALAYSSGTHGDPATHIFDAFAGDPVVWRAGTVSSNQFHTFSVDGHVFPWEPGFDGFSEMLPSRALGPGETQEAILVGGAGGRFAEPGDYMYRDGKMPWSHQGGMWGIFRVWPTGGGGFAAGPSGPIVPLDNPQQR